MTYSPIFGTGLARSGGGLYSMCLSTHPQMMVACCPNIELFRSYRNAVLAADTDGAFAGACQTNSPLQDWYGSDARLRMLDHMLDDATLDLPFDEAEWPGFLETSIARGELETADLVKNYGQVKGATYGEMFENLLSVIANTRDCGDRKWVGLHETWVLDFYPMLARAFPDARFLLMFRDPRATVSSMLGVYDTDPLQVGQILSYVRHWRKNVALALRYMKDPLFAGRLHVTAHDLIVTRTEETLTQICNAFDLDLEPRMLDTENMFNYATGATWTGNSSFEKRTVGISSHRAFRWKEKLSEAEVRSIEYLCGPELELVGYQTFTDLAAPSREVSPDVTARLLEDHTRYCNWRSDLGDPLLDLGLEGVRRQLLTMTEPCEDKNLIRRAFLFEDTYHALREQQSVLLPDLPRT